MTEMGSRRNHRSALTLLDKPATVPWPRRLAGPENLARSYWALRGDGVASLITMASIAKQPTHLRSRIEERRVSLFAAFLRNKSEASARTYRLDLADLTAWISGVGERPSDVPDDRIASVMEELVRQPNQIFNEALMAYRDHLIRERKCAPNTVNRRFSAIRSYVALANTLKITDVQVAIPRESSELVRDVAGPGTESYRKIMRSAEERLRVALRAGGVKAIIAARDLAILTLYHDAGLRRFEPLDVAFPEEVDLVAKRLRFRGKGKRSRSWFDINNRCVNAIATLISVRGKRPGPLFFSTHTNFYGKPISVRTANKIVAKAAKAAGVKATPHGLRHTAATTLLSETGGNVRSVAEFLRHSGLELVQRYDDERQDQARKMGELLDRDDEG